MSYKTFFCYKLIVLDKIPEIAKTEVSKPKRYSL